MFSIIIPSLNEGYYLDITLDSIYNYVDSRFLLEIIIVDDFSQKNYDYNFLEKHKLSKKIRLIKNSERKGPSYSRNIGACNSRGKYLIFIDAHMYCKELNLKKLLKMKDYLSDGAIQGIVGSFADKKADGYIYKIKNKLLDTYWCDPVKSNLSEKLIIESPCSAGGFTIIKKEIFEKIGGFNQYFNGWGAEDLEISLRLWMLGYKIHFTNKFYLAHYFKKSFNYEVDSEKVFFNKYIIYKMYFEGVYKDDKNMLLELINNYGEENCQRVINQIEKDYILTNYIDNMKKKFKNDINWYLEKFDQYISL